jgi:acetyl-CoA carboxylase carboxyl transferase subunit alpha
MCAAREKKAGTTVERQKEIDRLEKDVEELRRLASIDGGEAELERLKLQVVELRREFYAHMGPWQRAQIARHPQRPYTMDWINLLITDFVELHGDRGYGDIRNFGQPKPEGYRKALRIMKLAAKYNRPVLSFVDTPGAYPGIDAEERGQGEAIARNLLEMARLPVPIIVTVTGEGGSGGALAIAIGDRVNILENGFYSVISPEGCASIIWRDSTKAETAAIAMKIMANDLKELGIIDEIIPEPDGGAHADHEGAAKLFGEVLERQLLALTNQSAKELVDSRYQKFRHMCQFFDILKS